MDGVISLTPNFNDVLQKKKKFNGTSAHLLDGYISANQRFFLHS